jgi:hypothetical protein
MLIRFGDHIINLGNVLFINLDYEDDDGSFVRVLFNIRGTDGRNTDRPYTEWFDGETAETVREYLMAAYPDLLDRDGQLPESTASTQARNGPAMFRFAGVIVNLDNVLSIEFVRFPTPTGLCVDFRFNVQGCDDLADDEGNTRPFAWMIDGKEAEAVRRHLTALCPDLTERAG